MDHGLMTLHATFDRAEVATSILIAIVASYAALALSARVGARRGTARLPWLIGGGSAVGLGIAGMHFVGMLAMRLNVQVSYDELLTVISFAVAVVASTTALAAATSARARLGPMFMASTIFGVAVAGMHYVGMAAMRGAFDMTHDPGRVALSIAIAIVASGAAFWMAHNLRDVSGVRGLLFQILSATVMGTAVAGMHYTAMSAVTFSARAPRPEDLAGEIVGHDIANLVTIVGLIVLISAIIVAFIDQRARQVEREAELANERYREMANAMPQIVWTARGDGSVDYFNDRWVEYTGLEAKSSMAHWIDAFHPEDAAESAARWGAAVATGKPYDIEYRLKRADGEYRWHLGRAVPLRDPDGFIVKWFGTCTDIHEQKRAESYLRAHQATLEIRIEEREAEAERATALYQLLAENATDMVSTHRPDGMFEYATPSWIEFVGATPSGQYPVALSHPDDTALLMTNYRRAFETTEPITTVWRCRRADDSYAWLETRTRAVRQAGTSRVITFVCATRDITQAKHDEIALRQSEEKYRQLVEQAAEAILLVDAEGLCVAANPRAASLAAVPASMLMGRVITSFMVPVATPQRGPRRGASSDASTTSEYAIHRPDGKIIPVEASVVALPGGRRQIIARDISGRKELERLKDEFISVVSHELRTPLASIRGALGLLASGQLAASPDKSQRMLTVATANAERLIRLINDILDVERIDSGMISMDFAWCDGSDVAAQVIEQMRPVADGAGVTLRLTADSARMWADADRLTQTLTNLVGNAVKFSPRGSTIEIIVAADRDAVRFAVRDEGRGIPPEKLETIFDRFQQVDASDSREKGGTGLGLAICRGIVDQHGGRIWAENNPTGGAVFKFVFPRRSSAEHIDLWSEDKPANVDATVRILVIEDDVGLAQVTAAALESRGLSVYLAHSGTDALQRYGSLAADVLIVDLALPDVNGLDLLDEIRRRGPTGGVPAIIYTAYDPDAAARDRIKHLGAELATKARVPIETLVERVIELLESSSSPSLTPLKVSA